jgi:DnaJ-class molecular chaperone
MIGFKKKNMEDPETLENGGTPEGAPENTEEGTVESAEETTEEKKTEDSVPMGEIDPAYNCPDCKGEGATFPENAPQGLICPTCKGTGKV